MKEYIKKKPKKLKPRKRNHAPIEPPSQEYYDNCYLEIYGDFIREQKEMNEIQTNEANEKKIINFVIRLFSEPNTYSALFRVTKNILSSLLLFRILPYFDLNSLWYITICKISINPGPLFPAIILKMNT